MKKKESTSDNENVEQIKYNCKPMSSQITKGEYVKYGMRGRGNLAMECCIAGVKDGSARYLCPFTQMYPAEFGYERKMPLKGFSAHMFKHMMNNDLEKYPLKTGQKFPNNINKGFIDGCGHQFKLGQTKPIIYSHILKCKNNNNGYYLLPCSNALPAYMLWSKKDNEKGTDNKTKVKLMVKNQEYILLGTRKGGNKNKKGKKGKKSKKGKRKK